MTVTLRPNQLAAADAVEAAFRAGITRPLVDSCVGSGKSLIYAELARREIVRGGRVIIGAHTRELVEQNASACQLLGLDVGINCAALGQKVWRAPVICAGVQSIHRHAHSFGPIAMLAVDEAHLLPHSEAGMYRALHRALGEPRMPGGSGTVFRLQGGSLVEGEGAPFQKVVYTYSILDGIRDGYLCPAFSLGADDKLDPSKLRVRQGDYTSESSDAQMLEAMDKHIAQMVHYGWQDRRAWLVFEAGTKAARAMTKRMGEWGIPTGLVLGDTPAGERASLIAQFRAGQPRAMVNVAALTTGFDVPHVDLLVFRRRTKSLGLYIQMAGRGLRTIGGNIEASIAAGKPDCAVLDFAGIIDEHGPLDFIRVKETKARLVSCEECGARCPGAALKCWSCNALMTKLCPACLATIRKGVLDCPECNFDMRTGPAEGRDAPKLLETPSGAALISSLAKRAGRTGGWVSIRKCYASADGVILDTDSERVTLPDALESHAPLARWAMIHDGKVTALLVPNGSSRTSALQLDADGRPLVVPMPPEAEAA